MKGTVRRLSERLAEVSSTERKFPCDLTVSYAHIRQTQGETLVSMHSIRRGRTCFPKLSASTVEIQLGLCQLNGGADTVGTRFSQMFFRIQVQVLLSCWKI